MRKFAKAGVLVAALAASETADAEGTGPIVALTVPGSVVWAMHEAGFRAKLSTADNGNPIIESGASGTFFGIEFYGCENGTGCESLLFVTSFDLEQGLSGDAADSWNRSMLMGRVYLDENCDPSIDHFMVADPLMSDTAFVAVLEKWDRTVSEFRDYIGYDDDAPKIAVICAGNDPT